MDPLLDTIDAEIEKALLGLPFQKKDEGYRIIYKLTEDFSNCYPVNQEAFKEVEVTVESTSDGGTESVIKVLYEDGLVYASIPLADPKCFDKLRQQAANAVGAAGYSLALENTKLRLRVEKIERFIRDMREVFNLARPDGGVF